MKMDAIEALANATIGLAVSWVLTWAVLGFPPVQSAAITAMFFVVSFTRAWVLRALFRRCGQAKMNPPPVGQTGTSS